MILRRSYIFLLFFTNLSGSINALHIYCTFRLVLLGPTEAGKSSMVESLIAGKAVLVNIEDRTQVVNLKEWNISKYDIVHICDHGGH